MLIKQCSKCLTIKSVKDFYIRKENKSYRSQCKSCHAEYRAQNKERYSNYHKEYYKKQKEYIKEKSKKYYSDNRDYKLNYQKEYRKNNKEKVRFSEQKHYKNNKSKIKNRRRKYEAKRRQEDLNFNIKSCLRSRMRKALKGLYKSGSAIKDLGYSIEYLKKHLESQFKPGMTWENWGTGHGNWQIDHIEPLSSFDLTDREQFLRAVHYTNLQPLWYEEHVEKDLRKC